MSDNNIYEFGEFQLDCQNFALHHRNETIQLQPRVFDTLVYLVEHPDTVVTKEELTCAVWGKTDVQDNTLMRCISQLRKALNDVEGNKYIRTVPSKGYRFCVAVKLASASNKTVTTSAIQTVTASRRPRVFSFWLVIATLLTLLLVLVVIALSHKPRETFNFQQLTTNSKELPIFTAAISPDGNMLAFADESGMFVSDIKAIERHSLPLPPGLVPGYIEWFPDSIHLLVTINNPATHQSTLWNFSTLGGMPVLLLKNATKAVISPDGLRIAFIRNDTELWLANSDGSSAMLFATAPPDELFSFRPQIVADSRSIIIGSTSSRFDYASITVRQFGSNKIISLFKAEKNVVDFRLVGSDDLIISWKPTLASQGTNLTLQKVSLEKGALSSPRELLASPDYTALNISATRDGKTVALINSRFLSDAHMADLSANGTAISNSRRFTLNDSLNRPSGWLSDNHTVLFYSDRAGHYGIYRQAIDSVDAFNLVNDEHENIWPVASADQRWLFYFALNSENSAATSRAKLMRMPLSSGMSSGMSSGKSDSKSIVIDDQVDAKYSLRCAATVNRCVLAGHVKNQTIYFEFDPEKGRGHELVRVPWKSGFSFYDWDVCADGTRIAYIDAANGTDAISIITLSNQPTTITQLHIPRQEQLRTLRWDAVSEGFYVSTFDDDQDELKLLHIAIDGSVHLLRQQISSFDGWAMPSADGKHLAFQKYTLQGNIWLLQRQ